MWVEVWRGFEEHGPGDANVDRERVFYNIDGTLSFFQSDRGTTFAG